MRKYLIILSMALIILVFDQWSKFVVVSKLSSFKFKTEQEKGFKDFYTIRHPLPVGKVSVVPGFFDIRYVENPYGAWGMFAGVSDKIRGWLFPTLSLFAVGVLIWFIITVPADNILLILAMGCVSGGALGNFVDRFNYGYVIDFLDFYIGRLHWPTFNVADSFITIGLLLIIADSIIQSRKEIQQNSPDS